MKIVGFTGCRADFGLLAPVFQALAASPRVNLELAVCGAHLSEEFGLTKNDISTHGFRVGIEADILASAGDGSVGVCRAMGEALRVFGPYLESKRPDAVVLLGDRYEALSMSIAAVICQVPVVHVSGGESTFGAMDEAFRHCITKLASLHFPSCESYRRRIIQLGENPDDVYTVGSLGVQIIKSMKFLDRDILEKDLKLALDRNTLLVTYHPCTLEDTSAESQVEQLLLALDSLEEVTAVFTLGNADPGGRGVNRAVQEYARAHPDKARVFASLGQVRYLSVARLLGAVVGNSSSGITEIPSLGVPTVNIGTRQQGRIRAESVIDCAPRADDIARAIRTALSPPFRKFATEVLNPYEGLDAAGSIRDILLSRLHGLTVKKIFYDLPGIQTEENKG